MVIFLLLSNSETFDYSKITQRATNPKPEEPIDGNKPTIIRLSIWFGNGYIECERTLPTGVEEYSEYRRRLLPKGLENIPCREQT